MTQYRHLKTGEWIHSLIWLFPSRSIPDLSQCDAQMQVIKG